MAASYTLAVRAVVPANCKRFADSCFFATAGADKNQNSMSHRIRLAGPWQYSTDDGSTWQRCTLPFDAGTADNDGQACRLRRKFHRPTGTTDSTRLTLLVSLEGTISAATVNGLSLAFSCSGESSAELTIEISNAITQFNVLELTIDHENNAVVTSVVLQIEEPS